MSLFDRWMSNLVSNKSLINPIVSNKPTIRSRKKSSPSESSQPATPSHKSYPSIVSHHSSIKPPSVKPSQESRIVRTGPQNHRRRALVSSHNEGSGEEDNVENTISYRHPFHRTRLLSDERTPPLPDLHKVRSNARFFQHGPLSIEQIRNLFWVEEIAPEDHYIQTARSLNLFRQRKRHCDVRLITDNGRTYAHKAVLVSFSQDLENRLEASSLWKRGKMSVDLCNRGLENVVMDLVVNWMYTGSIRCNVRDNFDRLFTVAEGLKIPRLMKIYRKLSTGLNNLTPGTSYISDRNDVVQSEKSESKPWPSFSIVITSEDFLRWTAEKIIGFLSSDSLAIDTELDIYTTALRWLNHAKLSRIGHLDSLMSCVRWIYMTSEEIVSVKHMDSHLFSEPSVSAKAAMGQWQRDLLRRGIKLPLNSLPVNRVEKADLR